MRSPEGRKYGPDERRTRLKPQTKGAEQVEHPERAETSSQSLTIACLQPVDGAL
jgi:hypothetical protein